MRNEKMRIPLLMAFWLSLGLGLSAQLRDDGTSAGKLNGGGEMNEKKALYEQLGIRWTYDEPADVKSVSLQANIVQPTHPDVTAREQKEQEFELNREQWFKSDPARYNRYRAELGMHELPEAGLTEPQDVRDAKERQQASSHNPKN